MYFLSQDSSQLVESCRLYIKENAVYAVIPGSDDLMLAQYEIYGEAQEMLHKVYTAIEDGEAVFSFEA